MADVPKLRFFVSKQVNLFYNISVLFSEYFSDEYSLGILNNSPYRERYVNLKTQSLHEKFQSLWRHSFYSWDFVGKSLFKANTIAKTRKTLQKASQEQMDIWAEILSETLPSYENIWSQIRPKLEDYRSKFEEEWNLVNDSVLSEMSNIAKLPWKTDVINVHFVDCVYGAQGWAEDVVAPPFPDLDVEKKLLSHEIAHILVPDYLLKMKLQSLGLDCAIAHTIVDLIAYFGVKKHIADLERRGIKPNPDYYAEVSKLYAIFENCQKNPDAYRSFDEILKQIKL